MNVSPMMTDAGDPLDQMRQQQQQQMLMQQAAHFRPLNVAPPSSGDLFAPTQNFNGSLSKMMADEGWFCA